jgi:hypothetical protein
VFMSMDDECGSRDRSVPDRTTRARKMLGWLIPLLAAVSCASVAATDGLSGDPDWAANTQLPQAVRTVQPAAPTPKVLGTPSTEPPAPSPGPGSVPRQRVEPGQH